MLRDSAAARSPERSSEDERVRCLNWTDRGLQAGCAKFNFCVSGRLVSKRMDAVISDAMNRDGTAGQAAIETDASFSIPQGQVSELMYN